MHEEQYLLRIRQLESEIESIFFFTKEMSDEFIAEAVEYCAKEIEKLRKGEEGIDMFEYAWNRAGV